MDDADGVEVLEREHELRGVEARAALVERTEARHVAEEVAAARQRQHEMCTRHSQQAHAHRRRPSGTREAHTTRDDTHQNEETRSRKGERGERAHE